MTQTPPEEPIAEPDEVEESTPEVAPEPPELTEEEKAEMLALHEERMEDRAPEAEEPS
jgi:hypothetical protein